MYYYQCLLYFGAPSLVSVRRVSVFVQNVCCQEWRMIIRYQCVGMNSHSGGYDVCIFRAYCSLEGICPTILVTIILYFIVLLSYLCHFTYELHSIFIQLSTSSFFSTTTIIIPLWNTASVIIISKVYVTDAKCSFIHLRKRF